MVWYCSHSNYMIAFFPNWKQVLVPMKSIASGGSQCLHLLSHEYNMLNLCSLWVSLNFQKPRPHRNLVIIWHFQCYKWMRCQGTADTYIVHVSSAHTHSPLSHWTSLTEHKLRDIVENFKTLVAEYYGILHGILNARSHVTTQVTYPWSQSLSLIHLSWFSSNVKTLGIPRITFFFIFILTHT